MEADQRCLYKNDRVSKRKAMENLEALSPLKRKTISKQKQSNAQNGFNILNLPNEILCKIFSEIYPYVLVLRLELVCQRFNEIASSDFLWSIINARYLGCENSVDGNWKKAVLEKTLLIKKRYGEKWWDLRSKLKNLRLAKTMIYFTATHGLSVLFKRILEITNLNPKDLHRKYKGKKEGESLLYIAAINGRVSFCDMLLDEYCVDVNETLVKSNTTALHGASAEGHSCVIETLIKHGAECQNDNQCEMTPLELAIENGREEAFATLVKYSINDITRGGLYSSAFVQCIETGETRFLEVLLRDAKEDPNALRDVIWCTDKLPALTIACRRSHPDTVLKLLEYGADVNQQTPNRMTAAYMASKRHNIEIMDILRSHGADFNIPCDDGMTPLLIAIRTQHPNTVRKLLLECGANVNQPTPRGLTPAIEAVNCENIEIMDILRSHGADFNIRRDDGMTPLIWSIRHLKLESAKKLLDYGIDAKTVCFQNKPLLCMAVERDSLKAVEILVEKGRVNVNWAPRVNNLPIYRAISENKNAILKYLIKNGAQVNAPDEKGGETMLFFMCRGEKLESVRLLLEDGFGFGEKADPNVSTRLNTSCLHAASQVGCLEMVKLLLDHGARVNTQSFDHGVTALHIACKNGNVDIVKLLLTGSCVGSEKADPNILSKSEVSPLHLALDKDLEMVKLLLDHGARINARSSVYGTTVLHIACNNGNVDVVRLLLTGSRVGGEKADPNVISKNGVSPLDIASRKENLEMVKELLKHGAQINTQTDQRKKLLYQTCQKGDLELLELILTATNSDNLDIIRNEGYSLLCIAANFGHYDTIEFLLNRGARTNALYGSERTPLSIACERGHFRIAELLLSGGIRGAGERADPNFVTKSGYPALHIVSFHGHSEIVKLLIERGAEINARAPCGMTALFYACSKGMTEIVKLLLTGAGGAGNKGADPNIFLNESDFSPLHVAALHGYREIVELLIEHGAKVNAQRKPNGETALIYACQKGYTEIVKLLVEGASGVGEKVDVNIPLNDDVSPLHLAACYEHCEIAKILLENGASSNAMTRKDGFSVLHSAVVHDRAKMVSLLLEANVNPNATCRKGITPLHMAVQKGNIEILLKLISAGANVDSATFSDHRTPLYMACQMGRKRNQAIFALLLFGANPYKAEKDGKTPADLLGVLWPKIQERIQNFTKEHTIEDIVSVKIFLYAKHLLN